MRFVLLLGALALSGCGLFSPTFESCDEVQAYAGAREIPPLAVPEGVDAPDTRNALKIPAVTTPERPLDGRCIDAPQQFAAKRDDEGLAPKTVDVRCGRAEPEWTKSGVSFKGMAWTCCLA